MIVFDLLCAKGHVFETWFASSREYEAMVAGGDVACPECGDTEVKKAVSAPHINAGVAAPAAPCGLPACAGGSCRMMDED